MAYIGNSIQTQGFTPAVDYFSGNGSTVTFTLSRPVAAAVQVEAVIDNVVQNPSTAYTVSGNAITFTSAPLSGSNNIYVRYTSLITTYNGISQSPSVIGDLTASGGYLSTGSFNNSFVDGTIVDYVTGNGRITVGSADGFTLYTGGTSARSSLASWDASGNLTNAGTLTTSSRGISAASVPAGSVIQVIQVSNSVTASTTSSSYSATNLTASITPKFSTSKILILCDCQVATTQLSAANFGMGTALYRNSTQIFADGGQIESLYINPYANYIGGQRSRVPIIYLDSPATTSSTAYTVYLAAFQGTAYFSQSSSTSTITLMEIAA